MIDLRLAGRAFLHSSRPSFVLLAPVCIWLGIATAWAAGGNLQPGLVLAVLLAGVFGHISVNLLNEHHDFQTGLDFNTVRTPFSGGTGFLPQTPNAAPYVRVLGWLSLLLVCLLGGYLMWHAGWGLLLPGALGVLLVLYYTSVLNRFPLLCWSAPGLGFGAVIMLGTHYALTGSLNMAAILAALVTFLQVNNLLLLNQFPDIAADRQAGRRHLLIAHGVRAGIWVYGLGVLAVPLVFAYAIMQAVWPVWSLLALIVWLPSVWAWRGACRYGEKLGQHHPSLAANVVANLLVPLVLGVTLVAA